MTERLRQLLLKELAFSEEMRLKTGQVVLRVLVLGATENFALTVPLGISQQQRREQYERIRRFLVWRQAKAFVLSGEAKTPRGHVLTCLFIGHANCLQVVRETHTGRTEWFEGRSAVDPEILGILPEEGEVLSDAELDKVQREFGNHNRIET